MRKEFHPMVYQVFSSTPATHAGIKYIWNKYHFTHHQQNTYFPSTYGIFTKTDNILANKPSINKFSKVEPMKSILSEHNGIKLEINSKYNGKNITLGS